MADIDDLYANLAAAGMAVTATVGATSSAVIFSQADAEALGGLAQIRGYTIRFRSASLSMAYGTTVTINAATYTVREVSLLSDGTESIALLSKN